MNTSSSYDWRSWVRWIVVLPGAVLASLLAELVFGVIFFLNNGFLSDGQRRPLYVDVEMAIAGSIAFVCAGTFLAPKRKAATSFCLALLYTLFGGFTVYFEVFEAGSQWWVVAVRDVPRLILPLTTWLVLRFGQHSLMDEERPIASATRRSAGFLTGSRLWDDYHQRMTKLGLAGYLRILFCWDLAGLVMAIMALMLVVILSWSHGVSLSEARTLRALSWIIPALLAGRALFHRRAGVLANESYAFNGAAVLVLGLSVGLWLHSGLKPVGHEGLETLLGLVGVLTSYIIAIPLYALGLCMAFFFPWMFMRGFENDERSGAWQRPVHRD